MSLSYQMSQNQLRNIISHLALCQQPSGDSTAPPGQLAPQGYSLVPLAKTSQGVIPIAVLARDVVYRRLRRGGS